MSRVIFKTALFLIVVTGGFLGFSPASGSVSENESLSDFNLIWATRAGGRFNEYGFDIAKLSDDSIVVTGNFYDWTAYVEDGLYEADQNENGHEDILVSRYNSDGSLDWVKIVPSDGKFEAGYGITALSDDSTIVTGNISGTATFGVGEVNETVLRSHGGRDIFVARYSPDGTLAWAIHAGGQETDKGMSVIALSDDSFVVTGNFMGVGIFGEGDTNQTVIESVGVSDPFIARYNSDGSFVWVKQAGGIAPWDGARDITVLSDDSIVIAGYFSDDASFGKGEMNETVLEIVGKQDIFIARYNPDGTLAWVKRAGGMDRDAAQGITALSDDSIIVTGDFNRTATFGEGDPNETTFESDNEGENIFVACYNPEGTLAWVRRASGSPGNYGAGDSVTILSDDSIVVTGAFHESVMFAKGEDNETGIDSAGASDIFVALFTPDGYLSWVKSFGGLTYDSCEGVISLSDDSVALTGAFGPFSGGELTFGAGEPNETVLVSAGVGDIYLARFAP